MKCPHNFHGEIMRLVVKATRRGDIAEVECLTWMAEPLRNMTHRHASATDRANKVDEDAASASPLSRRPGESGERIIWR